jgi:hypothetical protein
VGSSRGTPSVARRAEIDTATNEVTIASGILRRDTVCGTKTSVKLHRSVHRAVILLRIPLAIVTSSVALSISALVVLTFTSPYVREKYNIQHISLTLRNWCVPNIFERNGGQWVPDMSWGHKLLLIATPQI